MALRTGDNVLPLARAHHQSASGVSGSRFSWRRARDDRYSSSTTTTVLYIVVVHHWCQRGTEWVEIKGPD